MHDFVVGRDFPLAFAGYKLPVGDWVTAAAITPVSVFYFEILWLVSARTNSARYLYVLFALRAPGPIQVVRCQNLFTLGF